MCNDQSQCGWHQETSSRWSIPSGGICKVLVSAMSWYLEGPGIGRVLASAMSWYLEGAGICKVLVLQSAAASPKQTPRCPVYAEAQLNPTELHVVKDPEKKRLYLKWSPHVKFIVQIFSFRTMLHFFFFLITSEKAIAQMEEVNKVGPLLYKILCPLHFSSGEVWLFTLTEELGMLVVSCLWINRCWIMQKLNLRSIKGGIKHFLSCVSLTSFKSWSDEGLTITLHKWK